MELALYHYVFFFIAVISSIVYGLDKYTERLPDALSVSGPIVLLHSKVGFSLVERIAQYKTTWKRLGTLGVIVCFIGMILSVFGVGASAVSLFLRPDSVRVTDPTNYLAIPGVNDFLPASVAVEIILALLIGMVLHEGAHAVLCRVEGIELESTGLVFLSIIPMGAFVEPDEESKEAATRIGRMRMAAAGILQNLFLTVTSMITIALIASLLLSPTAGAAVGSVYSGAPADNAIQSGEVITGLNGEQISSNDDFTTHLANTTDTTLTIQTNSGQHTINRSVFIIGSQSDLLQPNSTIQTVNETTVTTTSEFTSAVRDTQIAEIQTENTSVKIPIGAKGVLSQTNETVYITKVNGERVISAEEYKQQAQTTTPTITYYTLSEDEFVKHQEALSADQVTLIDGVSGIVVDDTGIVLYPSAQYLSILQFSEAGSLSGVFLVAFLWIVLPLGSVVPGLEFNFAGFTSQNTAFYDIAIGGGTVEGAVFFILTALFWIAWMNFNLALFNCLPVWSLDGQHVLRDGLRELKHRNNTILPSFTFKALELLIPLLTVLILGVVAAAPLFIEYL